MLRFGDIYLLGLSYCEMLSQTVVNACTLVASLESYRAGVIELRADDAAGGGWGRKRRPIQWDINK